MLKDLKEYNLQEHLERAMHAAGGVTDGITAKVIKEADDYLKNRLAAMQAGLEQQAALGINSVYEPLRGAVANLGIQQEGIAAELFRAVARVEAVENVAAGAQCPCISGRCPCPCRSEKAPGATGCAMAFSMPGPSPVGPRGLGQTGAARESYYMTPSAAGSRGDAAWGQYRGGGG